MTAFEKKWWYEERARGYNKYLLRCLLKAGLPFGIMMTLMEMAVPFFTHHYLHLSFCDHLARFGFYVLAFGWFSGACNWRSNEIDYKRPTEDDQDTQPVKIP
jgi:hypothetical protein